MELQVRTYLQPPEAIDTTDRAVWYGNQAAQAIASCKAMIARLEEYQQQLYQRVQLLESAPYHLRLTLRRERRWKEKVLYHLITERVYDIPGIRPKEESRTTYPGTERNVAIKAYNEYRRSHPGIEAIKDIDRPSWER
jgi:hypothetical protein